MAGEKAQVYMLIVTKYGRKRDVSNKLLKYDIIQNVHELYGQFDIIISIKADTMREVEDFIANNIRTMKDIERTETLVVSDVPK
jgi:DNA-binding Lrp family transcriptional regulator